MLKVYLAGPEVFIPDPQTAFNDMKAICKKYKIKATSPLDKKPPTGTDWEAAEAIYNANVDLIEKSDAVIANVSPFRGPSMDVGTAYEIGYANALGKLVIGYTNDNRDYLDRVRDHYEELVKRNGWRDPDQNLVEDFGLPENLMIAVGAIDITDSFEDAVKLLVTVQSEVVTLNISS